MSGDKLTYEVYNENSFVVRGDRKKHGEIMKTVKNSRWNPRLRDGAGWTVSKGEETALKRVINISNNEKEVKSRKDQTQYHRAISNEKETVFIFRRIFRRSGKI